MDIYEVLPLDAPAAREWARLIHRKSDTLIEDALIAAIAKVNRLTVVTRNIRHFRVFDVPTVNPFDQTTIDR